MEGMWNNMYRVVLSCQKKKKHSCKKITEATKQEVPEI